ncbi:hypothetical protein [Cobetia amphilecti]|nr:hypothetical protein [Cobetia amphilecti]
MRLESRATFDVTLRIMQTRFFFIGWPEVEWHQHRKMRFAIPRMSLPGSTLTIIPMAPTLQAGTRMAIHTATHMNIYTVIRTATHMIIHTGTTMIMRLR